MFLVRGFAGRRPLDGAFGVIDPRRQRSEILGVGSKIKTGQFEKITVYLPDKNQLWLEINY